MDSAPPAHTTRTVDSSHPAARWYRERRIAKTLALILWSRTARRFLNLVWLQSIKISGFGDESDASPMDSHGDDAEFGEKGDAFGENPGLVLEEPGSCSLDFGDAKSEVEGENMSSLWEESIHGDVAAGILHHRT